MSRRISLVLIAVILAAGAFASAAPVAAVVDPRHVQLSFVQRASGFTQPVGVVGARDGTSRLFVLEKTGRIRLWNKGVLQAAPYLDLRAKVSTVSERYCIPASNPFATSTRDRREIWLWGLRNPWRMTVDRRRALIWIGDVGQSRQEEVDAVAQSTRGANLGWSCYEGFLVFNRALCTRVPRTFPLVNYNRVAGSSVTGGYVYAGRRYDSIMRNLYVFGDFGSGRVWVYSYRGAVRSQGLLFRARELTSFGEDFAGEIWAVTIDGRLWSMSARAV